MSKRRTTSFLAVRFNKVVNADVNNIDFIFRQERDEDSEPYLLKNYPRDVRYDRKGDRYIIPWTQQETAMFLEDHAFYMDTRVVLTGGEIPETNIVKLTMNATLFDTDSEYEFTPWKSGRSPYIGENGDWYEYSEEDDQWVDTGVVAKGNGIYNITQNDDKTLTILMDDGETYNTDPVQGKKGDKGDDGGPAVWYTLESNYNVISYDPASTASFKNAPSQITLYAYKYENGVKMSYTAPRIDAVTFYITYDSGATSRLFSGENVSSLVVNVNEEMGWAEVQGHFTDPYGNTIYCRVPSLKFGATGPKGDDGRIPPWSDNVVDDYQVGDIVVRAITNPPSFDVPSVGDLFITGGNFLLQVTSVTGSTVTYVVVADMAHIISAPPATNAGDILVWDGIAPVWMSMADWQSTYGGT